LEEKIGKAELKNVMEMEIAGLILRNKKGTHKMLMCSEEIIKILFGDE